MSVRKIFWFSYLTIILLLDLAGKLMDLFTGDFDTDLSFFILVPGYFLVALYALEKRWGPDLIWKIYAFLIFGWLLWVYSKIKYHLLAPDDILTIFIMFILDLLLCIAVYLYTFRKHTRVTFKTV